MSQSPLGSILAMVQNATNADDVFDSTTVSETVKNLFASWLNVDLTTLAACVTIFGMISMALDYIRYYTSKVYWSLVRSFTSSISIPGDDYLNREVIHWISKHVLDRQGTRILTARTKSLRGWDRWNFDSRELQEENERPIRFLPTFGTTWFVHERGLFMVRRIGGGGHDVPDEYAAAPNGAEHLLIMRLGRSVVPIKGFINVCRDFSKHKGDKFTSVSVIDEYMQNTVLKPVRHMDTVHFDETVKAALVADIEKYLSPNTRKFYTARGIPYRRGYLFHGTPGTGKSSLSLALAGRFRLELFIVHLPSIKGDKALQETFMDLPPKCFVLLEDIDAVGIQKRSGMKPNDSENTTTDLEEEAIKAQTSRTNRPDDPKCTLAGLLNVLDGVAAGEGRIVLMTSNRAHMLDKALIRPGRIDRKILLGNISKKSAERMFLRMYQPSLADPTSVADEKDGPQAVELQKLALEFSNYVPELMFTPAILQGYLLDHKDSPADAVEHILAWVAEQQLIKEEANSDAEKKTDSSTGSSTDVESSDVESPDTKSSADIIEDVGEPKEKM